MQDDNSQNFLDSLPELKPGDSFAFACHPQVACFNACCSDLTMPLTPYDVLRLRRSLGESGQSLSSESFILSHARVSQYSHSGFPILYLKMREDLYKTCPFVTERGCGVYLDRSSACRTYPMGRATKENEHGETVERFFLVREAHCKGFEESKCWTAGEWFSDQGLQEYNHFNDRYMKLMSRFLGSVAKGEILSPKHVTLCLLALYELDRFGDFIRQVGGSGLLSRLSFSGLDEAARQELEAKILSDEQARLSFGLDWVELVLFGDNPRIALKA